MYLFTRVRTARTERFRDALAWAIEAKDHVSEATGLEISLYANVFGRPLGTLTWAALVENRADMSGKTMALMEDDDYWQIVARSGELFHDNGEDFLRLIIALDGMDEDADPPAASQAWTAQIANGQFDHAMDWGTDMGAFAHDITGVPMATLMDSYGDFGRMTWIAGFESPEHADQVNEQLMAESEWIKRLNYAEDLFLPGTGQVWLNRRIA